ncbi:TonB-dependent receptor [Elizabethkingia sp. JS20170427COW]|uniref:SusC/RagA family TonB-linked outer membrane protein n=1 Tax=Elizabethkingia sp. JS20170427COW TaxID=2583851 RepID=UPI001110F1E7|nr:TonB-dependent receptor [Elizabethkingia sp. JS20170427COW]QCX53479.1 TonB-dependent receptor [Elizabethkingia sp. JS20170427COW]
MIKTSSSFKVAIAFFVCSSLGQHVKSQVHVDNVRKHDSLSSTKAIDEVIVIGYGSSKKKSLTSSIYKLNTKDVDQRNVSTVSQLLQGQVSGVNLTASNGTPGSKNRVSIRGISSINGDNEPLYVVDGIILSKSAASYNYSGEFQQDPLSLINPSDIESVEVLKDAAATAIYGSRGANGVIIINTAKGKKGLPRFGFSQLSGFGLMPKKIKLLSSSQYIDLQKEAVENYNTDFGYTPSDANYIKIDRVLGKVPTPLKDIGWQDLIIRSASLSTQTDFSVSGGNDKVKYFNSLGYANQEGMIKESSLKRYSLRSNIEYKPNDFINLGFNIAGNYTDSSSIPNGDQGTALFQRSLEQRPYDSPYLSDGSYAVGGKDILRHNALLILAKDHTSDKNYQALMNFYGSIKFWKNFIFKTSYNAELRLGHGNRRQMIGHPYNGGKGWINDQRNTNYAQTFDNTLSYSNKIGEFSIDALIGHSFFKNDYTYNSVTGQNFPSDEFKHINAATIVTGSESKSEYAIESYFSRVSLDYSKKYYFSGSIRKDGSSRFGRDNRYDYFPSLSFGWAFSEENFLQDSQFISFGKLRFSWGKTGNQDGIGNYDYFALAQGGYNYNNLTGISITNPGNKDLRWETNTQTNLGVDLTLWNGRVSLTYDYFNKKSEDLLYNVPTLQTSGFSSMTKNIGKMSNKGHEFSISTKNINHQNFSWDTSLNMSFIKNKVESLLGNDRIEIGGWHTIIEGQSLGTFLGYQHDGIYQSREEIPDSLYKIGVRPGDIRFADLDSNGIINSADKTIIGNPNPDFYGGVTNRFRYKNFDLSILATFSVGNDIVAVWRTGLDHLGGTDYNNILESYENRWMGSGTSNWVPRATKSSWNMKNSSYYIEDGSYIRIKNITLGYSLPLKDIGISKIRLFMSINNLFTFTKYSGYDPEAASGTDAKTFGIDNLVTPQSKSFLFGINMNF